MRTVQLIILALIVSLSIGAGVAQDTSQTSTQTASALDFQVPESFEAQMKALGPTLQLSLQEAIRMALANNLEIAIENFNEGFDRENTIRTQGFFDPRLTFTVGYNANNSPTTSVLEAGGGIAVNNFTNFQFNTRFDQNVKGGGALFVTFNNNRQTTNSTFSFIDPRFNANFSANFTQPLWRGSFKQTNTERQLKLFNLDSQVTDTQFQTRVADVIQQVQNQYWELVYAAENYETNRQSMELAIIQYRNNEKRVAIGVMAPIEITASEAEVASRMQTLIQSEVQIIATQNGIKRSLAPDPNHSIWDIGLLPTDQPPLQELAVTLDEAMTKAVGNRPELDAIDLEIEKMAVDEEYYKRDSKPRVDLQAFYGSVGASGTVFDLSQNPPAPNPDDPRFGGIGTSWSQLGRFSFTNYGVFVNVEIPLKNRVSEANLATTHIRTRQLQSQFKNQEQVIKVEVRNAFQTIKTRKRALDAARVARRLSEEQLNGENKRFEAGLSTNFEVLRFQRDLAFNKVSELRAMIDYQLAIIALEKAMFTIVEQNDIVVARGEAEAPPTN